jgi:hypothetical protein
VHFSRTEWFTQRTEEPAKEAGRDARKILQISSRRPGRCPIRRKERFIADWVAAGLLFARTDAVDEWLLVALALSIEIFLGESPRSFCNRGRLSCLNGSIKG